MLSYQHSLAPRNSGIKVTPTWPFCMSPEVDSYNMNAHNLTYSIYNIKLNIWFLLMGHFTFTSEISDILCYPIYLQSWHQASVEPLYKNTHKQTMAQVYQLNINDWVQTLWHYLTTQRTKAEKIKTFTLTTIKSTQIKQELKRPSAPVVSDWT